MSLAKASRYCDGMILPFILISDHY